MDRLWRRLALRAEQIAGDRLSAPAATALLKTLAVPGNDSGTTLRLARRLQDRGDTSAAIKVLADAVSRNQDDSELSYRHGFLLEQGRQFESAIDAYSLAIASGPSARLFYRRARCYEAQGETELASVDLGRSLRLDPRDLRAHRALLKIHAKDPVWARLEILEAGYRSGVADRAWIVNLADAHFDMEHFVEAAEYYGIADAEVREDRPALRQVESLYRAGLHADARAHFKGRVATLTNKRWGKDGLGAYMQSRGLWSAAADEYVRELEASAAPDQIHRCGYAHMRAYRHADALPFIQRASRTKDAPTLWSYHEGLCLEKLGRSRDATDAYLWAYASSESAYHLYRAVYVCRGTNQEATVANVLMRILQTKFAIGTTASKKGSDLDQHLISVARRRNAREQIRTHARRALKAADFDLAKGLFTWLCDTEAQLVPQDHEALAAILLYTESIEDAFVAYLSSRAYWGPHGLDESDAKGRPTAKHMQYLELQRELPVRIDKVLYEANHGAKLTCNVLPLLRRNLQTERGREQYHVVVLDRVTDTPEWLRDHSNVIVIARESYAYLRHLATAGWLINNNTFPPYFARREEQRYLNTWHGTPIKTLGRDIKSGTMDHRNAARNFLHATHMLLPNEHTAKVLIDRYDVSGLYTGKAAITGYPRIDASLDPGPGRLADIRRQLGADGPVVLYAPTWRGTLRDKDFDTDRLVSDLRALKRVPGTIVFQPHPLTESLLRGVDIPAHTVPAGIDTNELLAAVDVLITDYSSIFFDFYPLDRPVFLYAYDEAEYFAERGAYFPLDDLPGTVCRDIEQLVDDVTLALSARVRKLQPGALPASEFCPREDGQATDRALAFFFEDDSNYNIDTRFGRPDRPELLFFSGSFIPNGITSSFLSLTRSLLTAGQYNINVALQPEPVFDNPDRRERFGELPQEVRVFGRVGTMAATLEETWLINQFNAHNEFFSPEHRRLYQQAFAREFHRVFGCARFSQLICFEGYARFWAALFLSASVDATKHTYLHSDMEREYRMRFSYLRGMFSLYSGSDTLISVSESVRDVNQRYLSETTGLTGTKMLAARNMVDVTGIRARAEGALPEEFRWPKGRVFVTTGRLTPEKGHDLLLHAFAKVCVQRPDCSLIIVGDGPLMEPYQAYIRAHGLDGRVLLPGYMENPLPVVRRSDCFVFPSRYEGQGLSLVEALVLGLPAIGGDVVGVRSVLEGGYGRLVPLTVDDLAAAMLAYLDGERLATTEFAAEEYVSNALAEFGAALSA